MTSNSIITDDPKQLLAKECPQAVRALSGIVEVAYIDQSLEDIAANELLQVYRQTEGFWSWDLDYWLDVSLTNIEITNPDARLVTALALAIVHLRFRSQQPIHLAQDKTHVHLSWKIIHQALTSRLFQECNAARSHQGFLSVPFCRLSKPNGDNEELWRFHIWLPQRPQPSKDLLIHSHKSWAQSWRLSGEGKNTIWTTRPTEDLSVATHAVYQLALTNGKSQEIQLNEQKIGTTITNSGKLLQASPGLRETHTRHMSYVVPVDTFHTSQVPLDCLHSTIFVFDASRGFVQEAGVSLGPKDGTSFTQYRDPREMKASTLAKIVAAVRDWESSVERMLATARATKWSSALKIVKEMRTVWHAAYDQVLELKTTATAFDIESLDIYGRLTDLVDAWLEHMIRGEGCMHGQPIADAQAHYKSAQGLWEEYLHFQVARECCAIAGQKLKMLT